MKTDQTERSFGWNSKRALRLANILKCISEGRAVPFSKVVGNIPLRFKEESEVGTIHSESSVYP